MILIFTFPFHLKVCTFFYKFRALCLDDGREGEKEEVDKEILGNKEDEKLEEHEEEKDSDKSMEKKPGSRSSSAKKKPRPAGMSEADRKEQEDIERAIAESMKDLSMDQPDKAKTKTKGSKGVDAVKREKSEDTGLGSVFD